MAISDDVLHWHQLGRVVIMCPVDNATDFYDLIIGAHQTFKRLHSLLCQSTLAAYRLMVNWTVTINFSVQDSDHVLQEVQPEVVSIMIP